MNIYLKAGGLPDATMIGLPPPANIPAGTPTYNKKSRNDFSIRDLVIKSGGYLLSHLVGQYHRR